MKQAKLEQFMDVYGPKLQATMQKHPDKFMKGITAETICSKVKASLDSKGVSAIDINTIAWRHAAKTFGHANTYTAWQAWFNS